MGSPRITYTPRNDTSAEIEAAALANIYRHVHDSANKNAADLASTNGSSVKCTEEVSNVERRAD